MSGTSARAASPYRQSRSLPKLQALNHKKKTALYRGIGIGIGIGGDISEIVVEENDDAGNDPIKSPHDLYLNTTELEKAYYVHRAQELRKKEFIINDYILKDLNADNFSMMKQDFYKHNNAVSIPEFVRIMRSQLQWSILPGSEEESLVVTRLIELFKEIDVDNSGDITWHEFTSYVIKNGFVDILEPIKQYVPCKLEYDIAVHAPDKVSYISAIDKMVVLDRGKVVRIYKPMRSKVQIEYMRWKELSGHVGNIVGMEYIDEGGGTFVTAGTDNKLILWDCAISWRLKAEIPTRTPPLSLRYSKQHHTLFVGSTTGIITAWGFETEAPSTLSPPITPTTSLPSTPGAFDVYDEDVSPSITSSPRKKKPSYTWRERGVLKAHTDMVMDMALITNTPTLASCGMDAGIVLWDTYLLQQSQRLHGHTKGVLSLAYSSDYRMLISAGFERDAFVWNPVVNRILYRLKGHYSSLVSTHAVEGTPQVMTADKLGTVKVWDIRTFECVQTIPVADCPDSTSFTTCHRRIIIGGNRSIICFEEEKPSKPYLSENAALLCCLYNSHSDTILTAAGKGVKVWDAKSGMLLRAHDHISPYQITSVCFEGGGQRKIFIGNVQGEIRVHHYGNGSLITCLEPHTTEVSSLIYSTPRQCLLSTGQDALLRMHDTLGRATKSVVKSVHCGSKDISVATDSPDQGLLACASASDNSIRLWDVERWGMEAVFRDLPAEITSLVFLDPYPLLVCGDSAGFITFFSVRPSLYKNQLLLRFNTNTQPTVSIPPNQQLVGVCSLVFPGDGMCLYTGNELGMVTGWDVTTLLQKGNVTKSHWALRKGTIAAPPPNSPPHDQDITLAYTVPTLSAEDLSEQYSWPAHSNAVTTLCSVVSPPAILSGSRDCRVRAWSRRGEYYGSLRQAPTGGKWTFPLDDESLARAKSEQARDVLFSINNSDGNAPISHITAPVHAPFSPLLTLKSSHRPTKTPTLRLSRLGKRPPAPSLTKSPTFPPTSYTRNHPPGLELKPLPPTDERGKGKERATTPGKERSLSPGKEAALSPGKEVSLSPQGKKSINLTENQLRASLRLTNALNDALFDTKYSNDNEWS